MGRSGFRKRAVPPANRNHDRRHQHLDRRHRQQSHPVVAYPVNAVGEASASQARMARANRTRLVALTIAWAVVLLGYTANDLAFLIAGVLILFIGAHERGSASDR